MLGFGFLFSRDALDPRRLDLGTRRPGTQIAFALPLAMLAYTGLETVANLAEEASEPGATSRAASSPAIGAVVVSRADRIVGLSAFPSQ